MLITKQLYFIIGFLIVISANCQAQIKVRFLLTDCRDETNDIGNNDTLILYKTDGLKIEGMKIPLDWGRTDSVEIAEPGQYSIVYVNLFEQIVHKRINIQNSSIAINICVDSLKDYVSEDWAGVGRLENLLENEWIAIDFVRSACFEYRPEQIKISRKNGQFVAQQFEMNVKLDNEELDRHRNQSYKTGNLIRETVLNNKQQADFLRFENELNQIVALGCTTSDYYRVTSGSGLVIERVDGGCSWQGYDFLIASFFPKRE